MKILITAGGTIVPIDSVRYIANMSTGKFGHRMAEQFAKKRHDVTCFHSESSVPRSGYKCSTFRTYWEYNAGVQSLMTNFDPDIVISAAAVSDYELEKQIEGKIARTSGILLRLTPVPKVLPLIKKISPKVKLVGFKLLVEPYNYKRYLAVKKQFNCAKSDIVAYNDLNSAVRKYDLFTPDGNCITITSDDTGTFCERVCDAISSILKIQ